MTKRQNEIIDAALKLTATGGIQHLTVKNLSEAVGITEPALYRHFKNKAEIVKEMIGRFDRTVPTATSSLSGLDAIKSFIRSRFEQVCDNPDLASVMFAEELFMADSVYRETLLEMMHRHKKAMQKYFRQACKQSEIRNDIAEDILFRLVFGPVRLLVRQWGMSGHAFDLRAKGEELLAALVKTLAPVEQKTKEKKTMNNMFCFQCQETLKNSGCTMNGMCGKKAVTANLMDALIRRLKILTLVKKPDRKLGLFVIQSLFMTITNANFDDTRLAEQIRRAEELTGPTDVDAPLGVLSCENEDIRSLRELLTCGLKGIAAYADHAAMLGHEDDSVYEFVFKGLAATTRDITADELTALVLECGSVAVKTMAMLDAANTGTYGNPQITKVKIDAGPRPGILVSGHDLRDMKELLEQSKDAGIDIYTHSEMLPAHYYPELRKYTHLYGNYGNAWHRQGTEFASFNGPILMTTNCITPVQDSYKNRIFTTGMAGYPGVPHIADRIGEQPKDFSALIELAKQCAPPTALEEGEIVGGFAHNQVLALADQVVAAIKSGAIRRFVVMAGCDGRHKTREYFTDVASKLPAGTVILTAGCAKYRYNKLDLGTIGGIPRLLDAGQCNDCYSLAVIALKLKEAFGLDDVNKLPLSFDIGWYEQKAVAVLLAVLSLGFKNIRLGPTLPAFLSPGVTKVLVDAFDIKGITTPEEDIDAMMAGK